jgi:hypothetical protein
MILAGDCGWSGVLSIVGSEGGTAMMLTPLGGMVGGRILPLGALAGDATSLMVLLVFGLLVVTTLVILLGGDRRSS